MCHFDVSVLSRLIVAAQDRGMMRGDYVWFLFTDYVKQSYLQPWTVTNLFNSSSSSYRFTALYAVNLVSRLADNLLSLLQYGLCEVDSHVRHNYCFLKPKI